MKDNEEHEYNNDATMKVADTTIRRSKRVKDKEDHAYDNDATEDNGDDKHKKREVV